MNEERVWGGGEEELEEGWRPEGTSVPSCALERPILWSFCYTELHPPCCTVRSLFPQLEQTGRGFLSDATWASFPLASFPSFGRAVLGNPTQATLLVSWNRHSSSRFFSRGRHVHPPRAQSSQVELKELTLPSPRRAESPLANHLILTHQLTRPAVVPPRHSNSDKTTFERTFGHPPHTVAFSPTASRVRTGQQPSTLERVEDRTTPRATAAAFRQGIADQQVRQVLCALCPLWEWSWEGLNGWNTVGRAVLRLGGGCGESGSSWGAAAGRGGDLLLSGCSTALCSKLCWRYPAYKEFLTLLWTRTKRARLQPPPQAWIANPPPPPAQHLPASTPLAPKPPTRVTPNAGRRLPPPAHERRPTLPLRLSLDRQGPVLPFARWGRRERRRRRGHVEESWWEWGDGGSGSRERG